MGMSLCVLPQKSGDGLTPVALVLGFPTLWSGFQPGLDRATGSTYTGPPGQHGSPGHLPPPTMGLFTCDLSTQVV
jgi:hypothetical protein